MANDDNQQGSQAPESSQTTSCPTCGKPMPSPSPKGYGHYQAGVDGSPGSNLTKWAQDKVAKWVGDKN